MRALRERVAGADRRRMDAILAVAMIIVLELQCWLGAGIAGQHQLVTAFAAVFFAAPIAVRRAVPGFALVFSAVVAAIRHCWAAVSCRARCSATPGRCSAMWCR